MYIYSQLVDINLCGQKFGQTFLKILNFWRRVMVSDYWRGSWGVWKLSKYVFR